MNDQPIPLNEALIRKVAELARLKIEDGEVERHLRSIREILQHVDQLAQVDTQGVEPMYHGIDDSLRLREDRVREFERDDQGKPKVLQHAPEVENGGFKVPRIVG